MQAKSSSLFDSLSPTLAKTGSAYSNSVLFFNCRKPSDFNSPAPEWGRMSSPAGAKLGYIFEISVSAPPALSMA